MRSFGEDIRVTVAPAPEYGTSILVESQSALKTTRVDWGANVNNVKAILKGLERRLTVRDSGRNGIAKATKEH